MSQSRREFAERHDRERAAEEASGASGSAADFTELASLIPLSTKISLGIPTGTSRRRPRRTRRFRTCWPRRRGYSRQCGSRFTARSARRSPVQRSRAGELRARTRRPLRATRRLDFARGLDGVAFVVFRVEAACQGVGLLIAYHSGRGAAWGDPGDIYELTDPTDETLDA